MVSEIRRETEVSPKEYDMDDLWYACEDIIARLSRDEETDEKTSSLVTVWAIPQNLKNQVLGLQKKKKEETVNG